MMTASAIETAMPAIVESPVVQPATIACSMMRGNVVSGMTIHHVIRSPKIGENEVGPAVQTAE